MTPRLGAWMAARFLAAAPALVHAESAYDPALEVEPGREPHYVTARLNTHAGLFQRALLPGTNGASVMTETIASIHEYASVEARNLDSPWNDNVFDVELAAWGSVLAGDNRERRLDGDIRTAFVRYHQGPVSVRLGRQHVASGAARYARFDGVALELSPTTNFDARVYGGFGVLPRWSERASYQYLGSIAEADLSRSDALHMLEREDFWLWGGRVGFNDGPFFAGLSFHEQRETGGLSRRNLGLDGRARLLSTAEMGANLIADLALLRLADARLWIDLNPLRVLRLSLEYLRREPALFLSQQSVLSVFSMASFHEAGGVANLQLGDGVGLEAAGFGQLHADDQLGARSEVAVRFGLGPRQRTLLRLAYARVLSPDNGYHSVRSSLSRRLLRKLLGTLEMYAYLYDAAIRGYRSSNVYAGTLSYQFASGLSVLWGNSLTRSPYAKLDVQTQLRLSWELGELSRRPL